MDDEPPAPEADERFVSDILDTLLPLFLLDGTGSWGWISSPSLYGRKSSTEWRQAPPLHES
jgi:hypothetical protein